MQRCFPSVLVVVLVAGRLPPVVLGELELEREQVLELQVEPVELPPPERAVDPEWSILSVWVVARCQAWGWVCLTLVTTA